LTSMLRPLSKFPLSCRNGNRVDKTPASFPEKVCEILANDLTLSGFFKVIDADRLPFSSRKRRYFQRLRLEEWTPAGVRNSLGRRSPLEPNGLNFNVKFHLFDLVERKHIVGKQYEGPLQTLRLPSTEWRMKSSSNHREKGVHNIGLFMRLLRERARKFISDFDGANIKQLTQNQSITFPQLGLPMAEKLLLPLT